MQAKQAAVEVVRTLRDKGHQAYLVGGCVRDLLLRREPADYDVATDATPDEVMRIFPRTWAVGVQFGVVLVPGLYVLFASMRKRRLPAVVAMVLVLFVAAPGCRTWVRSTATR